MQSLGRASLALPPSGCSEEARAVANELINAAEATHDPVCSRTRFRTIGTPSTTRIQPDAEALRRGLVIAETAATAATRRPWRPACPAWRPSTGPAGRDQLPHGGDPQPSRRRQRHPDPYHAGYPRRPFRRRTPRTGGRRRRFAFSPIAAAISPEINAAIARLREVLGDPAYESLARKGETMTTAAMATYAYDQIDPAQQNSNAPLNARSGAKALGEKAGCQKYVRGSPSDAS